MKTDGIQPKIMVLAAVLAVIMVCLSVPATEAYADDRAGRPFAETVDNVVPRMVWALNERQSAPYSFTFGEDIHEFRFAPIDIRKMEYLEFDIYLPDIRVVDQWKTGETEFEITSSGTCDVDEYAWSGYDLWRQAAANGLQLSEGWNHVKLDLPKDSPADLSGINYIRWYWNEDGPDRNMAGCQVANLKFTVKNGMDPAGIHLEPFIPETVFETEDVPVALADVTKPPYNADPAGENDSTKAIQDALDDVSLYGGGTVWMPAGKYRITGPIKIPAYVTLRGDWSDPETSAGYGTLIVLDIPEEDRNDRGTFTLGGCGGVYGLTVYYPGQSIGDVKAYPFTFYSAGHDDDSFLMPSVINCTVLNGYRGIGATTQNVAAWEEVGHENMNVLNFRGTFLSCGAELYNESDFSFLDDMKISTKYWTDASRAGILPPVNESSLKQYTKKHAAGLILGDLDWISLNNITVESCSVGIHVVPGKRPETDFQGLMYGITTKDCVRGLLVDALHPDIGIVLANSDIDGGLYNTTNTVIKMFNVKVNGAKEGRLREENDFTTELPVPDPDFGYKKPKAILYTADLDISGREDVSYRLQSLLTRAGITGGVVYLPAGVYRLDAPVFVPAGVELKGTSAVPVKDSPYEYGYHGTTLLSYYTGSGPDDRALVTLNGRDAGLNGLRINYPENHNYNNDVSRNIFDTAYAVKGTAANVYVVNTFIASSAYGVDLTGCDNHFVSGLAAGCYRNILKAGGKGGVIRNSFSNPDMFYVTSTPYVDIPQDGKHVMNEDITRDYCDFLILENASEELVYNIAMVAGHITLTNNASTGSTVINLSSDYLSTAQTVMNGGSLTVVNAMRWAGVSFLHEKGILKIYNRFEHGFSSGLNGDAVEETYIAWK